MYKIKEKEVIISFTTNKVFRIVKTLIASSVKVYKCVDIDTFVKYAETNITEQATKIQLKGLTQVRVMKKIGKDRKEQGYRRLIISKEVYRQMYPLDRIAHDETVYIYVNPFNKQVEVDIKSNWWGKITHKALKKPLKEKKRYLWDKKDYDRLIAEEKKTLLYQVYKKRNMKIANTQGIESNIIISCKIILNEIISNIVI